jgi:hypothetical protein
MPADARHEHQVFAKMQHQALAIAKVIALERSRLAQKVRVHRVKARGQVFTVQTVVGFQIAILRAGAGVAIVAPILARVGVRGFAQTLGQINVFGIRFCCLRLADWLQRPKWVFSIQRLIP